ncbi:MAG TPA: RDD family protein, partial [Polyangiales bacterium]|nr:RDD family protein [Polyangiales bacterium]
VSMLAYYIFFEAVFGRTPGKMLTGTRVVTVDGGTPSFTQILGRNLARYVPFEPFSFFGDDAVGWHDSWSGTRVVKVR